MCRLLLCCLAALLCGSAALADEVGSITAASGSVTVKHGGTTKAGALGLPLAAGDEIDTGPGSRAEFQLADGTVISLNADTHFAVDQYDYDQEGRRPGLGLFSLFSGSMRAITGAISRFQHRVEVTTPVATIGVRGTEFTGELGGEGLDVAMLEGQGVFVRNPQGDQVELNQPGHATHLAFHRQADGSFRVERPALPRILRREELARLERRIDWVDHARINRLRALRSRFERFDRAHPGGRGGFLRGPRFRGGRMTGTVGNDLRRPFMARAGAQAGHPFRRAPGSHRGRRR